MSAMLTELSSAWAATGNIEVIAVTFGLLYIIFAAKENIWCWPAGFVGTGTSIYLFWDGSLYMESALNVYYLVMAIVGWWQWQYGSREKSMLEIRSLLLKEHVSIILLIAVLTLISGYLLSNNTDAALPYLDSFTTWSAVITTWMVARKILENWLYWIVINSASIYLYSDRGFLLYAVLFALYVVIAIIGYRQWRYNYSYAKSSAKQMV
ncbi:MAG: nicotinamide mononucleotide transporter [Arenicella sp.]|jgi:nicotinamide mononucleotide transporter